MRIEVRKSLARYGYPPDLQKAAVDISRGKPWRWRGAGAESRSLVALDPGLG
ncbi:hypothetical protein [Methylosinus trichosporium]|uniref:hypothetical protein n=1 Tax=Methylosinus trichosporium TaxID=426 RepID=UPI000E226526